MVRSRRASLINAYVKSGLIWEVQRDVPGGRQTQLRTLRNVVVQSSKCVQNSPNQLLYGRVLQIPGEKRIAESLVSMAVRV
jgi:hypothetical protein